MNNATIILNDELGEDLFAVILDNPEEFINAHLEIYGKFPYAKGCGDYWLDAFGSEDEALVFIKEHGFNHIATVDTR